MKNTVGIIGCGWLGFPLAKSLIHVGYNVHGSTTNKNKLDALEKEGIKPFIVILGEESVSGSLAEFLDQVDILIINIPPRLRGNYKENYVLKMNLLHNEMVKSNVKKILFVSSTSVYGASEGEVTEDTFPMPVTESGRQLVEAEKIFQNDKSIQTTILRFGGLIGPNRHPITMLSGKKGLSDGNVPVNLIHLDDCIHLIKTVLENNWWDQIFNGVYPDHPLKRDYYYQMADKNMLPRPQYLNPQSIKSGKIVLSRNFLAKNIPFYTRIK
ncbi:SDR family oxidoreductase [uncultured Eudoraea sp.]|uniref:SDR family oxidoreductase n=1 Tax=uncultured Eudoraea sp. TaxID=1035614 RepID=UPI00261B7E0B|nr:SDR family oxidoreductase [uncultured Eudoraea sp.]